jgi:hypothetical protein
MPRISSPDEQGRRDLADALDESGRMTCGHCGQIGAPVRVLSATVRLNDLPNYILGMEPKKPSYTMSVALCAGCGQPTIFVKEWSNHALGDDQQIAWHKQLYPIGRAPKSLPNTPQEHLRPYLAACRTLEASPEASACMSRRCLQGILRCQGYNQNVLAKQIEAALAETDRDRRLPAELRKTVDYIRSFGNLSAHPTNDAATLEIIDVEPDEAAWCIEIAEQLMAHYFERPAETAAKIHAADAKRKKSRG